MPFEASRQQHARTKTARSRLPGVEQLRGRVRLKPSQDYLQVVVDVLEVTATEPEKDGLAVVRCRHNGAEIVHLRIPGHRRPGPGCALVACAALVVQREAVIQAMWLELPEKMQVACGECEMKETSDASRIAAQSPAYSCLPGSWATTLPPQTFGSQPGL